MPSADSLPGYDDWRTASPYERAPAEQRRNDQLTAIDAEIEALRPLLHRAIDGDVTLRRSTGDNAETPVVTLDINVAFDLHDADSVRGEVLWMLECLAGELGCRIVRRDGAK